MHNQPILEVKDLSVSFRMYDKALNQKDLNVIRNLTISVGAGEILAVAGSSGSGKSLLAHAVLGILPSNATTNGEIRYQGQLLTSERLKELRGKELAFVPQSVEYLDPLMRVGKQVAGVQGCKEKVESLFQRYGLAKAVERLFPFQLSGGMARRVLVATATMENAKLVIADEPTPGLSQKMAETTMGHLRALADEGCAVLLITHDIDLALSYADRIAVFYAGTTVETTSVEDFRQGESALRHPYTKALWAALPKNGFHPIPGTQPYPGSLPQGCLFAPRCSKYTERCQEKPVMRTIRGGEVSCIHAT